MIYCLLITISPGGGHVLLAVVFICAMGKYRKPDPKIYKSGYHIEGCPQGTCRDIPMTCERKSCEVSEPNVGEDHVYLVISISQKHTVWGSWES